VRTITDVPVYGRRDVAGRRFSHSTVHSAGASADSAGMAESMSEDQWRAFVLDGTRTGKLATIRADGGPNLAVMWFLLDGGDVMFTTEYDTMSGRDLRRDDRAALCVDDERPPFSFVVLRGRVEISEDPGLLLTWATAIAARYMGEDRAAEFGKRNSIPGMLLARMRIEHVTAYAAIA
jgi:PPOX class probable F420-dependent enzyme